MAKNISGSLRGVNIDGIDFRVAADANFSWMPSVHENSTVATSGKAMIKKIRRVPTVESLPLIVDLDELDQLRSFDARDEEFNYSIRLAGGGELKSTGTLQLESYENEEARANIQFHPTVDWTLIPA